MTKDERRATNQPQRMWIVWLLVVLALVVLSTVSVSVAEERNAFCASCHLRPEQKYVDRSRVKARTDAADLASAHAAAGVNCVGCHRGDQSLRDRIVALALGARNTGKFVAGQYDPNHTQVAVSFLLEDSCQRCHVKYPELGGVKLGQVNPVTVQDFDNHFHSLLFDPKIKTSVTCATCHPAHLESFPELQFIERGKVVLPACERCHQETGRGPATGLQ